MENELETVEIKSLRVEHASDICHLIDEAGREYSQFFTAFEPNEAGISGFLKKARKDQYLGFFIQDNLIGFFMLRGLDAGFIIPSYGVFIAEKYSSFGLARLSVSYAISFCKLNRIKKLMLKVHPLNTAAMKLYRDFGFAEDHVDPENDNLVFYKDIA
jgi:RimJ/RimL family protein N-acetyltransferase